jgi:lipid-binding SYLF domain-containing protein
MIGYASVAAATAVVGYDLARDTVWQQSTKARAVAGLALKGSAAALDTEVDIYVDNVRVGNLFNSGTGAPNRDDLFRSGAYVPAGSEVHLLIKDAPATNPINVLVEFVDM